MTESEDFSQTDRPTIGERWIAVTGLLGLGFSLGFITAWWLV